MADFTWLQEQSPYIQTLCGTLFTWGLTALGASLIYILPLKSANTNKLLDASLGFAAGVMLAASYWSLLSPALEKAEESLVENLSQTEANVEDLSFNNKLRIVSPVAIGFALGAAFVCIAGRLPLENHIRQRKSTRIANLKTNKDLELQVDLKTSIDDTSNEDSITQNFDNKNSNNNNNNSNSDNKLSPESWKRMLALIIAITVHNIPEGLAVGVGFGATDFANARNLAVGIGIQNFPEGLAVSLPLAAAGQSKWKAFLWGQFSGFVEPIFGMLGCYFVNISIFLLPYALGFAAGAMVFVVMDDIIPDSCSRKNSSLASKFSILGFIVMMTMDVALG